MMTQRHVAQLQSDVQRFVDQNGRLGPVKMSAIISHIRAQGWNVVDSEMFAEWVQKNVRGSINYKQ